MSNSSPAHSAASCPPAPARISMIRSFPSFASAGTSSDSRPLGQLLGLCLGPFGLLAEEAGHVGILLGLRQLAGLGRLLPGTTELAIATNDLVELRVGPPELAEPGGFGGRLGGGHRRGQLVMTPLDLFEPRIHIRHGASVSANPRPASRGGTNGFASGLLVFARTVGCREIRDLHRRGPGDPDGPDRSVSAPVSSAGIPAPAAMPMRASGSIGSGSSSSSRSSAATVSRRARMSFSCASRLRRRSPRPDRMRSASAFACDRTSLPSRRALSALA